MEQVLQGIPMLFCWVDDILVSGKTDQKHLQNLDQVLTQLEDVGQKAQAHEVHVYAALSRVLRLSYRRARFTCHRGESQSYSQSAQPKNKQQLRSFLGMENYYAKFIPNYSTFAHPLNELLCDQVQFKWTSA